MLLLCQRDVDPIGNRLRDFSLQREDVAEIAFVLIGPQVAIVRGVDEMRGDPHLLARAHDGALNDGVHAQFPRNGWQGLIRPLVVHRGGA